MSHHHTLYHKVVAVGALLSAFSILPACSLKGPAIAPRAPSPTVAKAEQRARTPLNNPFSQLPAGVQRLTAVTADIPTQTLVVPTDLTWVGNICTYARPCTTYPAVQSATTNPARFPGAHWIWGTNDFATGAPLYTDFGYHNGTQDVVLSRVWPKKVARLINAENLLYQAIPALAPAWRQVGDGRQISFT